MPINSDLNRNPYYDDYDVNNQFYKILFKPSFAVQARELTQLQSILQNQVEQFGDNIFKEGSIIKGCNLTELRTLQFVRMANKTGFDPTQYVGEIDPETGFEIYYEIVGESSGLRASIEAAAIGTQTAFPNLHTFFINYLDTAGVNSTFQNNEKLIIQRKMLNDSGEPVPEFEDNNFAENFAAPTDATGNSFGLKCSEGIIYQKGHFLYVREQLLIISKYTNTPNNISVGFDVTENIVSYLQDSSLLDNANGSPNQNAPGADRLKLVPNLAFKTTAEADADPEFFTIARYINGNAALLRDVSQYNVLGEEFARRTYEESGNYITSPFGTQIIERENQIFATVGPGTGYVKGYRVENRGEYQFAIDQINELSTSTLQNQPISVDYGNYLDIETLSGTFNIPSYSEVSLRETGGSEIGTAIVKNFTNNKVFICNVRMNSGQNFGDVTRLIGASGFVDIASTAIRSAKNSAFIFDTNIFSIKSITGISLPFRAQIQPVTVTDGEFSLSAGVGEDFSVQQIDIVVVDNSNVYKAVASTNTADNDSTLNVTLSDGSFTGTVTVYCNKRIQLATPYSKISKETYIKSNYSGSTTQYNLGFPDVYEVISITDFDGADVTSSFKLIKNQNDHFYDHSYIEYIPGRRQPVNGLMTVRLKVFQINPDSGRYFFTVDSYPVSIESNKIPSYKSASGAIYNLRECIDFRPHVNKISNANYNVLSPAGAPTISSDINIAPAFSGTSIIPVPQSTISADIEQYHNRTDVICIDSYGEVKYIKGEEDINSKPANIGELMKVAEIFVPGFPAISTEKSVLENKKEYAIKTISTGTKAYTMEAIEKIDKSVQRLTYYTALNSLELATDSINVLDENGLNRFKNGIVVDSFNDLTIADTTNPQFKAALDFTEKTLMPPVRTLPLNLVVKNYNSETQAELYPRAIEKFANLTTAEIASLSKDANDVNLITQPYATNFRNCVSNFYLYEGKGFLFPEYDGGPDVVNNPSVNIDIDISAVFEDFVDNMQEFLPLTSTSTELINSQTVTTRGGRRLFGLLPGRRTTTITDTFLDTQSSLAVSDVNTNQFLGDFVTNTQFLPFMRPKQISVVMYGLKPNTRHWVFFDKKDVNEFVAPAALTNTSALSSEIARNISLSGSFGDELFSDDNGILYCLFDMPGETFYVGDRVLEVVNVDQYDSIESGANSKGFLTYRAYNFSVEKTGLTVSTRTPDFSIATISTQRNVTRRAIAPGLDPIAQTFFVKKAMGINSSSVFVTKLDLYFKSKSPTRGATVELREVVNGYPSYEILPFSKVHLNPADVNVSDDSSVATTIEFTAPVRLDVDKEYAFVVMPDGADPDYLIYTCKVGGEDFLTATSITQDWGDGVLFTSTNNRAWKSYQDEDIKFTIYRANFSTATEEITLTNDNHEFFTISNPIGIFIADELVYKETAASISIGVVNGSNVITTSSGTNFSSQFNIGDYVLIEGTNVPKSILKVSDPQSTEMTLEQPVITTGTASSITATPIAAGNLSYYNRIKPNFIALEGSSARISKSFFATDTITGLKSAAIATISSVDDINLGYIQPLISRANETSTTVTASARLTDVSDANASYSVNMPFNDKTEFNTRGMQLRSRSNDLSRNSPFDITLTLNNSGAVTSTPIVDIETSILLAYQYQITNDNVANPETAVAYISKETELVDGFDASDFNLYITGYRPNGTDIKAYIKVLNGADPTPFGSVDWIELGKIEGETTFSSTSNRNDFREYVYSVPVGANRDGFGDIIYTSLGGNFTGYKKFSIKIELISDTTYRVPRIADYRGIALA